MLPGIYDAFQHWGQQAVWIYSDPHFGDQDLECGIKNRPSDEEQIANINRHAGRRDTLIILGDVGDIECVRRLRAAHKVLIMGNHDSGATKYKREKVEMVFPIVDFTYEQVKDVANKLYPNWKVSITKSNKITSNGVIELWVLDADNMLFDEVYEGALIIGEKLILSHEPVDIPWAHNIHGHDHAGRVRVGHTNVCSDVIGYKPINFNQWLKEGHTARIQTIHRETIDNATKRKQKRGGKKIGK